MLLGLLLLALGVVILLKNLGILHIAGSFWSILGPVLLIVLGLYIMMIVQRGRHYKNWLIKRYWDDEM